MVKKMKFPLLFRSEEIATAAACPWPACVTNPKTLSFHANPNANSYNINFKTLNSAFVSDDDKNSTDIFKESSTGEPKSPEQPTPDDLTVVRRMRSDRLFFEPGETNSILEEAKSHGDFPYYKESAEIVAMDSRDPCLDFRVSMEEMVDAYGLRGWECLEELLTCYLRVNWKSNHGYIIGAFVDLLIHLSLANENESSSSAIDVQCPPSSSSTATQCSFTSPLSFSSSTCSSISPCLSLMEK